MDRVEFTGAPGSPYTRKLIATLRYRHIPYKAYWGQPSVPAGYPSPKVRLLPTVFFPDGENGELVAKTDSTPIIRRLEAEHPGRSVLPSDPVLAFANELIEDYADEWLTKAMFHYRWAYDADIQNAGPLLVYWNMNTAPEDMARQFIGEFTRRQVDRLYVVGSNETTASLIEESYARLISILDALIARKGFVLGGRPSSADFALYGQLTQLGIGDPTPAALTNSISPRVRAWLDLVDDLSGLDPDEGDWFTLPEAMEALGPLLSEIGRTYTPVMLANAKAVMSGEDQFATVVDGKTWTQPTFKYQVKCLGWLREHYSALGETESAAAATLIANTGCEALFE